MSIINLNLNAIASILASMNPVAKKSSAPVESATEGNIASTSAPVEKKKSSDKVPDGYVSCRYTDLLSEIKYDPKGKLPSVGNAMYSDRDGKSCHWFCSMKPVGFYDKDGKVVKIADNAFERLVKSISKKWAMERDWIPEYRYTAEDNEAYVALTIQDEIVKGTDFDKIPGACFSALDKYNSAGRQTDYKTDVREEVCNDADRFMLACLFTGDVSTLYSLVDENGEVLPLPTLEALSQYTPEELSAFDKIASVFSKVREKHEGASEETWLAAQCFTLNMPTKDAIRFVYGMRAVGKKRYHRCEVAYSKAHVQVYTWILDEVRERVMNGETAGLEKWAKVLAYSDKYDYCVRMLSLIRKYDLIPLDDESIIIANPFDTAKRLEEGISDANKRYGVDFFKELNGETVIDEVEPVIADLTPADDSEDMPF